jgi:type I restriction enzyme, S subunit
MRLPPLSFQTRFEERREIIVQFIGRQRAHLARLDALFASLQHRAFRGELTGAASRETLKEMARPEKSFA